MAQTLATAYIQLVPSFKGGTSAIANEIQGPIKAAAAEQGAVAGKEFGKKFEGGLKGAKAGIMSAFKGLAGGAAVAGGLAVVGNDLLGLSGKVDQFRRKSDTVFEGNSRSIKKWAKANAEAMGLTDDELTGLTAGFGDLLKPMGFTSSQAAGMSKDVVGLAGALSSWSGGQKSAADVADALSSAMLGERDELKSLGISISQAEVDAVLAAKGQDKLTGSALQQAQAVATQKLIFDKSKDAQKAWAAGGSKALVAQNKLTAKVKEAKEQLAAKLSPALILVANNMSKIVPVVAAAAAVFVTYKAVSGAVAVGQKALAAAQKIAAGAQWALNAAMSANPIMLVVIALVALVAGVVIAYKKVGWFRDFIDASWQLIQRVTKAAFGAVIGAVKGAFDWVKNNWPLILAIITGPIGLAVLAITRNWDTIKRGVGAVKDFIVTKFGEAVDFIKGIPGKILGVATAFLNAGKMLGGSILQGLKNGITGAVGFAGDIAGSVWRAIKKVVNSNIIDKLNDAIPNSLGAGPLKINLPDNPIPRLHTGGPVTGPAGSEQLRILQAGEWVLSRSQVASMRSGGASLPVGTSGRAVAPLVAGDLVLANGVDVESFARRLDYEMSAA